MALCGTVCGRAAAPSDPADGRAAVGVGLVPIRACRLDQAHDRRSPLAGAQRTRTEPVLALMLNLA